MYGDNKALMSIMPELEANGVEPFFVLQQYGDFSKYLSTAGYRYVVCKFTYNNIYNLSKPIASYIKHFIKSTIWNLRRGRYLRDLINLLSEFKPQLVHTNNSANSFGLSLARELNIPHVWHIREYMDLDHNKGFFPSKNAIERLFDHPLNTCIYITDDVSKHFNTHSKKIVIYDGIIEQSENTLETLKKDCNIIYVGRIIETKGVYDIISAFTRVAKNIPNYQLTFIGDGEIAVKEKLQRMIIDSGISNRVNFLGYKTNIKDYMKHAKAIIVSSRFEAFGLITAEAMESGCLVIGRNTAGTKNQFDNGLFFTGNEIALRYDSLESLEESIVKAVTMPANEYNNMVSKAFDTVVNFYSVKKSASTVYSLYLNILNK